VANLVYSVVSARDAFGYGNPRESLRDAPNGRTDGVISVGGSMDAGLDCLETRTRHFERGAANADFCHIVEAAHKSVVPLILGSSGMAGSGRHLTWMVDVAKVEFAELGTRDAKAAAISLELDREIVIAGFHARAAADGDGTIRSFTCGQGGA
jgi:hypothetical protein